MGIIGHQKKLSYLQNFLNRGFLFPAFLFEGPEKVGKRTVAQEFIRGMQCEKTILGGCGSCPACINANAGHDTMVIDDVLAARCQTKELSYDPYGIEGVGHLMAFAHTTPLRAQYKIILIDNAHRLSFEAQNKLLKILEEPPSYCIFIFVSHKPESLIRTIRSRCLVVQFGLVPRNHILEYLDSKQSKNTAPGRLAQYGMGRPGHIMELCADPVRVTAFRNEAMAILKFQNTPFPERLTLVPKQEKESTPAPFPLLDLFQITLRDMLLYAHGAGEYAILLSRKQPVCNVKEKHVALRESLRLNDVIDGAVSPTAITRCFEYLALKL
ncbi:MAG: polymerase III, delta prime subunit protein [Parcubacteria group bacterium GW2011_GWF2_46_8]|nr:MAG: polymerase III, delta prime subunit protein [Parcubacteria group bacterium GW2011_GWF2_46_8]